MVVVVEGGYGVHQGRAFFTMELLGMNLAQMQRSTPGNRWGLEDVCHIGKPSQLSPWTVTAASVDGHFACGK